MGERKAGKAETLAEDKGDKTILIVQSARPTGETPVLPMRSQRNKI